jgi:hypothetical protein
MVGTPRTNPLWVLSASVPSAPWSFRVRCRKPRHRARFRVPSDRRLLRPFDPRNSRHPIDRFPLRVVIELNINIDRDSLELIGLDD